MLEVVETFAPLYKRDSKGKVRVWLMEVGSDGAAWAHRATSGLEDGEKVTSSWKEVKGKNIGRANETTAEQQARSEIDSLYTKKRDKAYFDALDNIDTFEKFKPMLASEFDKRGVTFDNGDVYAQPKLDGMRCAARADALWSRSGKEIVAVPHVAQVLQPVFAKYPDIVLDGELYNHALKDDFNKLMSLCRKAKPTAADLAESAEHVQYHVYDVYDPAQPDLTLSERCSLLFDILQLVNHSPIIQRVDTQLVQDRDDLDALNNDWLEARYEGQMIRYDTPYELKRSRNLLKRKPWMDAEFTVIAMHEGTGNWAGAAKNFEIILPNGETMTPAVKGKHEVLAALLESGKTPNWAKVEFADYTPDGSLRFPRVIDYGYGKRDD